VPGRSQPPEVAEAKAFLRDGNMTLPDVATLAETLLRKDEVSYARRVLARGARDPQGEASLVLKLRQQQALATSRDLDLPSTRHQEALAILERTADLGTTQDQETLGIAGGILKRWWELDGNVRHLERSLAFYRRAYRAGIADDNGYTAINTAFLLDLLAALDAEDARTAGTAAPNDDPRRSEAERIRREITETLPSLPDEPGKAWLENAWWFHATLAEAYFGLEDYERARASLERANACEVHAWQFESTIRQLATLAQLRAGGVGRLDRRALHASEPAQFVTDFLGAAAAEGALSARLGKIGLALSGGGFRASLFHIGVLAKLAELDVLRRVEVLSCVSGGSIVGAHYYLKVRELLRRKSDDEVTQDDYVRLVRELADEFLTGLQSNIRCRGALNPITHLRTIVSPDHTTRTIGALFERELYSKVADGEGDRERWLTDLFVHPKGVAEGFEPKRHNWLRRAKVPMLVLNATTLNTGHNWQFTASWMGEPPAGSENPADRNDILRRMYYSEAPEPHNRIRLGHAVAASACVPGLFNPIVLRGLYGQTNGSRLAMTIRLVDGGVHDNQGIASLVEQACSVMFVSDASGQMGTQDDPAGGPTAVPLRSSSILMARVRGAQYDDLVARLRASVLRGLVFVHMKQELPLRVVDWTDTDDPSEGERPKPTSYGISRKIQRLLASVRTDLDAFNDAEGYALMTSGYKITGAEFDRVLGDFPTSRVEEEWPFLAVEPLMRPNAQNPAQLEELLRVSRERFFKLLRLSRFARAGAVVALVVGLLAVAFAFWTWRDQTLLTVGVLGALIVAYAALSFVTKKLGKLRFRETVARAGIELALAVLAPIFFGLHLLFTNRRYLARGRVTRADDSGTTTIGKPGLLARAQKALSRNSRAAVRT
jgi:predicted acylesterase/phospholipase RssA